MSSPAPQPITVRLKDERRKRTDAERIQDLQDARRAFVEALSRYRHAKARLEALLDEAGDQ